MNNGCYTMLSASDRTMHQTKQTQTQMMREHDADDDDANCFRFV